MFMTDDEYRSLLRILLVDGFALSRHFPTLTLSGFRDAGHFRVHSTYGVEVLCAPVRTPHPRPARGVGPTYFLRTVLPVSLPISSSKLPWRPPSLPIVEHFQPIKGES